VWKLIDMRANLTIGRFSVMTQLSVKTLRHYHRVGLLEPAEVDAETGYRYYTTGQVSTAHVIRRFRDLGMPVEELRSVLAADPDDRNALILRHLDRLEDQLAQTRSAVDSLRALLTRPATPIAVTYRSVPATPALAVAGTVRRDDMAGWWSAAVDELRAAVRAHDLRTTGAIGGLFDAELFAEDRGRAVLFVPLEREAAAAGRARSYLVPAAELAVTVHAGPHTDIDRTYGALGSHVTEHELAVDEPVRETYLCYRKDTEDTSRWRTEIAWPVFRTTGS
jgi:DNA-binding transcriptional MerR regulator